MTEDTIKRFREQFPQFKGIGAPFPMFAETPVYTHIEQFITAELLAQRKEIISEINGMKLRDNTSENNKIYNLTINEIVIYLNNK